MSGGCLGLWGEGNEEKLLNGHGVLSWDDKNGLELDGDGGCTTLNVLNAAELYTLTWLILFVNFTSIRLEKQTLHPAVSSSLMSVILP